MHSKLGTILWQTWLYSLVSYYLPRSYIFKIVGREITIEKMSLDIMSNISLDISSIHNIPAIHNIRVPILSCL